MTNLDAVDGISFKKGCYTGQEIVARMHYLGTLKRRVFLAKIITDVAPQPGDALYASGTNNTQSIGAIVTAQPCAQGEYEALAVIDINSAAAGQIHLHTVTGAMLTFTPLPYTLE